MGKSSSGKDNIFKALVGDKELNLKTVIMYTTRPMRAGEKEGVEYYYVDNEKALELEAADKVIEMRTYNTVYGEWKYFTVDDGQIREPCLHMAMQTMNTGKSNLQGCRFLLFRSQMAWNRLFPVRVRGSLPFCFLRRRRYSSGLYRKAD